MLWDYIVVGGGLSGSVVSNRLYETNPSLNILVVEAGLNANNDPSVVWTNSTNGIGGEYDWNLTSVPQETLNGRNISLPIGKALGGGTVINGGAWTRGDRFDFDLWGETVDDDRWSYEGFLPFMKKTETFSRRGVNVDEHGFEGNVYAQTVLSTNRSFPLNETVLNSWAEVGVSAVPLLDGNAGNPLGVADYSENKHFGKREIASTIYSLEGVTVLTETLVEKILTTNGSQSVRATGIQLANGTRIHGKEVILSAGAIHTPQLLKLSGIGPAEELAQHGIPVVVDIPDVGENFVDHSLALASWTVRDSARWYMVGSGNPLFNEPQYGWGSPTDYITSTTVPIDGLIAAIEVDEGVTPNSTHPLLQNRTWFEHVIQYAGLATTDGSSIFSSQISLLTTSKGSVKLASANISDAPLVDPNYLATEVDRYVWRESLRQQIKMLTSNATLMGSQILNGEVPPAGFEVGYTVASSDEYLNARARAGVESCYHPMGSAAMGKVVDTDLKVKGVEGLRVVDTSVFPIVITAHLQVATYAMAEQAAAIIAGDRVDSNSGVDPELKKRK